jgi:hypothetical protein
LDFINPAARHDFSHDLSLAMQAFRAGVVPSRSQQRDANWIRWTSYCHSIGVDPVLFPTSDSVHVLQVFAQRYRSGHLSASHQPVRARTVEAALRAVGQTLASMGVPNPRLDSHGKPHYILQQQLKGYSRLDPPASRVKPIPFTLVHHLNTMASSPLEQAVADVAIIGFFFLLRPGEHTKSSPSADSAPFCLQDVTFKIGATIVPADTGPIDQLQYATFVMLRFSRQKNGTENEVIGHARSGHLTTCPVHALIRRCLHLRQHHASPRTPLCTVFQPQPTIITADMLTLHLRRCAQLLLPTLGFPPSEISARALRAGGAMALLCAQVDTDIIKLIGRWKSDQMLRYLHLQAYPKMHTFSNLMVQNGDFRLLTQPPTGL